jgi:hypothetical protein
MAETTGLVQKLTVVSTTITCVWIGPTATNNSLLWVSSDGSAAGSAFAANLIQTLAAAATNYRSVAATHGNSDSQITAVRVDPV